MDQTNHFRRIVVLWLVASLIMTPLVVFVLAPGMPPGNGTVQSAGQVSDNVVLLGLSTPIALAILVYFGYALWAFREREPAGAVLDGPPVRGNSSIQMWWLIVTTVIVLFLAGFGSVRLLEDGAGGGQGPNPIAKPSGADHALQVQVIAQQWQFTYRYPSLGGFETPDLVIPANTLIEFHVTSLDVIHSFWAYQLGVKVDANPGEDNVAYVQTKDPLSFEVHCAELCGVWHGYMFDAGKVVPKAQFTSWAQQQATELAPATKVLPPYSTTYFPDPQRRGG
jgi:cytochrome c oxidase subunit II